MFINLVVLFHLSEDKEFKKDYSKHIELQKSKNETSLLFIIIFIDLYL